MKIIISKDEKEMYPLTIDKPKLLLKVINKTIIEHMLDKIEDTEVVISGFMTEMIKKRIGIKYNEIKLNYFDSADGEIINEVFDIKYPQDLIAVNETMIKEIESSINGTIEDGCTIKGDVIVGKETILKAGTYIEGPVIIGENCEIGPNCYLRSGATVGNKCKVGQSSEIKNTIMLDGSKVPHLSYVGDSVLGEGVNFGAGTTTANLRHDNANVKTVVNDSLVDSGRRKFGAIVGDKVHTGINTMIYPGRKIWPGVGTKPGTVVYKDLKE